MAEPQQIVQRANKLGATERSCGFVKIRPSGGNQRLTSVRKNKDKLQASRHERLPQHLKRPSFKRVMRPGDGDPLRKVPKMGSVWWFSSTESITTA